MISVIPVMNVIGNFIWRIWIKMLYQGEPKTIDCLSCKSGNCEYIEKDGDKCCRCQGFPKNAYCARCQENYFVDIEEEETSNYSDSSLMSQLGEVALDLENIAKNGNIFTQKESEMVQYYTSKLERIRRRF